MSNAVSRTVALAVVAAGLAPAGPGLAQTFDQGFYLGLAAGYAMSEDIGVDAKFSTVGAGADATGTIPGSGGVDWGMAAGYQYGMLRGELEIAGQQLFTDGITISNSTGSRLTIEENVSMISVNGNLLVEAPIDSPVRPYIGGGAGYGSINLGEDRDGTLVWNGQGGLAWHVDDKLAVDAGYRYTRYGDIGVKANSSSMSATFKDFAVHSGRVGVRFKFGAADRGDSRPTTAQRVRAPQELPAEDATLAAAVPEAVAPEAVASQNAVRPSRSAPGPQSIGPQPSVPQSTLTAADLAAPPFEGERIVHTAMPAGMPIPAQATAAPQQPVGGTAVGPRAGRYGVQLAAYRSQDRAAQGWMTLRADYGELLDGLEPRVEQALVPGRGRFHRLYAAGATEPEADRVCANLKSRGLWCTVAEF